MVEVVVKSKKMRLLIFLVVCLAYRGHAQELYFPPLTGDTWEEVAPETLHWCPTRVDSLYSFLAEYGTKAFIVLKDGKIVLERYFDDFSQDSIWYWASAGKTLTAFTLGLAQEQGYLSIDEPTHTYLGDGWTSLTAAQEEAITVWHQLTMTTGLDDDPLQLNCTLPSCLSYRTDPGTRWAYHNAPYTLLREVVEEATGLDYNVYFAQVVRNRIGMSGAWLRNGFNNVYFSDARSMARYGLLTLNNGVWNGDTIMYDQNYFEQMVTPSQTLNQSYGYLWWLNGQESHRLPRVQVEFTGSLIPSAPEDLVAGLGKNDQKLYVIPSENMVVVRIGEASGVSLFAASPFDELLWARLSDLSCTTTSAAAAEVYDQQISIFPNPAGDQLHLVWLDTWRASGYQLLNSLGQVVQAGKAVATINVEQRKPGVYLLRLTGEDGIHLIRRIIIR